MTEATGRDFRIVNADCVEFVRSMPDDSVDMVVYSPPFESIYAYSDDPRDMSNCSNSAEFQQHYGYLARELTRVLKPGRVICVHCMVLPASKVRDGFIGIRDFPGDLIRAHQSTGLILHSKVVIWKDPVVAMQRTKALGLLWKQLKKDSAMSRMGFPDEVLMFRKPGENAVPITHSAEEFPVALWQKYASPIWGDIDQSDVLSCRAAREDGDQKHLCALQLEVYRRCLRLYSNPGELMFEPFAGIGSGGHAAIQEGRRFLGTELKESYFRQAVLNLHAAERRNLELPRAKYLNVCGPTLGERAESATSDLPEAV
jgi:hypothetical protein